MKKYIKTIVAVALLFCATSIAKAHPTNISSIMLIEQEPGEWIVQVNTSLTAFQYEIRHAFGENSYASPEEFNELVVKHFRKHMSVKINGEKVELTDGVVALGHATTLGFRLSGIPESGINDISVKNEGFKNIGKSKSIFSILKEGVDNDQFMLKAENGFQTKVLVEGSHLLKVEANSDNNWPIFPMIVLLCGIISFLVYKVRSKDFSSFSYLK